MPRRTRLLSSTRATVVDRPLSEVRAVVAGGRAGRHWYVDALPFVVRGGIDRAVGGAGRRWPPPDTELLAAGDRVGFWHVVTSSPAELLLRADVRAPGVVELRTRLRAAGSGTEVEQTVTFDPRGWWGTAYLLADLPAREAVIELTHRRLLRELRRPT